IAVLGYSQRVDGEVVPRGRGEELEDAGRGDDGADAERHPLEALPDPSRHRRVAGPEQQQDEADVGSEGEEPDVEVFRRPREREARGAYEERGEQQVGGDNDHVPQNELVEPVELSTLVDDRLYPGKHDPEPERLLPGAEQADDSRREAVLE